MRKHLCLLYFILLFPLLSYSQNWQGVSSTDTVYFTVSHETTPNNNDSNYLRVIYADSVSANANYNVYYFWKGIRGKYNSGCIDTLAPSWLGNSCIRYNDGREIYKNSFGDSILFLTQANINDTWTIAKDSNGTSINGTISQVITGNIDGNLDSIKLISLQANINGQPVNNPYNNIVLQLSKNHGWVQILDLYGFPNNLWDYESSSVTILPGLHIRLDNDFKNQNLSYINPTQKYAPGNEWIYKLTTTFGNTIPNTINTFVFDSIISFSQPTIDSVTFITYQKSVVYNPYLPTTYFSGLDTIVVNIDTSQKKVLHNLLPEVKTLSMQAYSQLQNGMVSTPNVFTYFLAKKYCGNHYVIQERNTSNIKGLFFNNGCWNVNVFSIDPTLLEHDYLNGFGRIYDYVKIHDSGTDNITETDFLYLKMNNCISGIKYNLLDVPSVDLSKNDIKVFPNPAKNYFTVSLSNQNSNTSVTVYDASGRMVYQNQFYGKIVVPTINFSSGIYAVAIKNAKTSFVQKLIIQ